MAKKPEHEEPEDMGHKPYDAELGEIHEVVEWKRAVKAKEEAEAAE